MRGTFSHRCFGVKTTAMPYFVARMIYSMKMFMTFHTPLSRRLYSVTTNNCGTLIHTVSWSQEHHNMGQVYPAVLCVRDVIPWYIFSACIVSLFTNNIQNSMFKFDDANFWEDWFLFHSNRLWYRQAYKFNSKYESLALRHKNARRKKKTTCSIVSS
jgi:hypothetical protein